MRRPNEDDVDARLNKTYEQSYGDADEGGWAPRGRFEDFAERSHYSSQRDQQEDRSGFRRGFQGKEETREQDIWPERRAHGDEQDPDSAEMPGLLAEEPEEDEEQAEIARALTVMPGVRVREYPGGWIWEFDANEPPPPTGMKKKASRRR